MPQICKATIEQRPHVVQCCGSVKVGLNQPLRIGLAIRGIMAVDVVTPVGGDLNTVYDLGGLGARLGELPSHAGHPNHRDARPPGQHHAHLEQDLELVLDSLCVQINEALCAVAALKHKGLPATGAGELLPQAVYLPRMYQGWQGLQPLRGGLDGLGVGVVGLLRDRQPAPA